MQHVILQSAEHSAALGVAFQHIRIQRLDPAWIDQSHGIPHGLQFHLRLLRHFKHGAQSDQGDIGAIRHDFGGADLQQLRHGLHRLARDRAARIADGGWTGFVVRHGPEHIHKFVLILRLHMDQTRHMAQVADIKQSVVGRAVIAA